VFIHNLAAVARIVDNEQAVSSIMLLYMGIDKAVQVDLWMDSVRDASHLAPVTKSMTEYMA
jgi:hypothetical protein